MTRTYHTAQQKRIMECLKLHHEEFLSAEEVVELLRVAGSPVGQATVYRSLERLVNDGVVMVIPSLEGKRAHYRYIAEDKTSYGSLVCTRCEGVFTFDCHFIDLFQNHLDAHHQFSLDPHRTVLYGRCDSCRRSNP